MTQIISFGNCLHYFFIMFQDSNSIVLDLGTHTSKIGYSGDDTPKFTPYSYVSNTLDFMGDVNQSSLHIGDKQLFSERSGNDIQSIFRHKGVQGYEYDYQKLQPFLRHHLQVEMGINTKEYSVLISQDVAAKPHQAKRIRQKMAQFLFEGLNFANIFFLKAPVLSCFATGRSSALIVDSGQTFTRSVAVHQGFCLTKSARIAHFGGRNISKYLQKIIHAKFGAIQNKYSLKNKKYTESFLQFHQHNLLSDIKQSFSTHLQDRSQQGNLIEYELPDKSIITFVKQNIAEKFITGDESVAFKGTATLVSDTINYCDSDIRRELYSNLLMTGGNILFGSNIQDLVSKVGESSNVRVKSVSVCAPNERKYLSWIGGSIVSSLNSLQSYYVGNQEWKEGGMTLLQKKCV